MSIYCITSWCLWLYIHHMCHLKSATCCLFPRYRTSRVLKVLHHLVAKVQVVIPGFIHQVATIQAAFDHLVLGHRSSEKVHREQREAHLKQGGAYTLHLQSSDHKKELC